MSMGMHPGLPISRHFAHFVKAMNYHATIPKRLSVAKNGKFSFHNFTTQFFVLHHIASTKVALFRIPAYSAHVANPVIVSGGSGSSNRPGEPGQEGGGCERLGERRSARDWRQSAFRCEQ